MTSAEAFNKVTRGLVEELGPDEALQLLREVFRRKTTATVYMKLQREPVSVPELVEGGLRANAAYDAMYQLRELGLVERDGYARRFPRELGGLEATVWRLKI